MEEELIKIIDKLGLDMNDPNLKDTPKRIAKMWKHEIFNGLKKENEPKVTIFPNERNYDEMVVLSNIDFSSTCSHHFVFFTGQAHIAYIPSDKIVGISKLARIVDYFAARPQIQEEMTKQISDYIEEKLKPLGSAVVIQATHGCLSNRGAKKPNAVMTTSAMRGIFLNPIGNKRPKEEFLKLIGK